MPHSLHHGQVEQSLKFQESKGYVKLPQFDLGVLALHVHLTLMPSVDLPIKGAGLRWGLSHRRGEQRGLPGGARGGVNSIYNIDIICIVYECMHMSQSRPK